jgi:hypothetical protein
MIFSTVPAVLALSFSVMASFGGQKLLLIQKDSHLYSLLLTLLLAEDAGLVQDWQLPRRDTEGLATRRLDRRRAFRSVLVRSLGDQTFDITILVYRPTVFISAKIDS